MEDYDLAHEHQRQAALQTMRPADPDNVEILLKELFGGGTSQWTGWDEQFVAFVERHRTGALFYGSIGDGWHFVFAAGSGEGFWIRASKTMTGKGLLRPESVAALTEVAIEKGLFRP